MKRYAEINGKLWEANLPFCCGCPEFIACNGCGYEGNGCRFPKERIKRPISFQMAYNKICNLLGKGFETYADELGNCLEE